MLSKTSPQIFVNGRFLTRRLTGVDRYAMEILRAIDEGADRGVNGLDPAAVTIVVPKWYREPSPFRRIQLYRSGGLRGQAWEQLCLPFITRHAPLVNFCNTAPICKRKQVVVIHDAATCRHPKAFSLAFRWWYRFLLPVLGKLSARVVAPSQFSAMELTECFGMRPDRIGVVPNAADHVLRVQEDAETLSRYGLAGRRYVLAVGTRVAYKNFAILEVLAKRLSGTDITVVSTGGSGAQVFAEKHTHGSARIMRTGYVSDEDLVALYKGAECFVFPSFYEGFGIPPLEAMALGCPVICSDAYAMREVLGDAASYFDPTDEKCLHKEVMHVSNDKEYRELLVRRGLIQAETFSWEQSAELFLQECADAFKAVTNDRTCITHEQL